MLSFKNILSNVHKFKSLGLGIAFFICLFILIYFTLYFFGFFKIFPDKLVITAWDGYWYQNIKNNGYNYDWFQNSNSAFFPLFPYTWRLLHLSSYGICLLNFLFFLSGIALFKYYFNLTTTRLLLFISFPTSVFFFLPYSEAFFFLFSTLFLVGLHKENQKLIFIGILLASLTRATAMFFIPSIILMELISSEKILSKTLFKNIFLYSLASLLGLFAVVLFQYVLTGEWFAFAKQQMRFWGHVLTIPEFPVVSHAGQKSLWVDGFAFFTGLVSFFIILIVIIKKFFLKNSNFYFQNRVFWFSTFYITMMMLYSLFFNIKCLDAQTNIDSLARYICSTAFFLVFLIHCLENFTFNPKHFLLYMLLLMTSFFLLGMSGQPLLFLVSSGDGNYSFVFFIFLFVYITFHYLSSHITYGKQITLILFSFNTLLSVMCFYDFISKIWIG